MTSKQELYFQKFGKEIPNRYKNDEQWIDAKLADGEPTATPEPEIEISIDKEEPKPVVVEKPVVVAKPVNNVTATVNDKLSNTRESYEAIQNFYGFTNNEAFMGNLDKYKLNEREADIVSRFVGSKTQGAQLGNLSYTMFKDWVKPIIEKHWLTGAEILDEANLEKRIYTSLLAGMKTKKDDITAADQAQLLAEAKADADKVKSHTKMMKESLQKKDKQWSI